MSKLGKATRPVFMANLDGVNPAYLEKDITFGWHMGMSSAVKQRSANEMKNEILLKHPNARVLEISTKSDNSLGVQMSAFNLTLMDERKGYKYPIENIFQASKVFSKGGPFTDLLTKSPLDAKRDNRIQKNKNGIFAFGNLVEFKYNNKIFPLIPKSIFYDYLYLKALNQPHNRQIAKQLLEYDTFTDIVFNPKRSINTQARSAAIYVSVARENKLNIIDNLDELKKIYPTNNENEQMSLIDF